MHKKYPCRQWLQEWAFLLTVNLSTRSVLLKPQVSFPGLPNIWRSNSLPYLQTAYPFWSSFSVDRTTGAAGREDVELITKPLRLSEDQMHWKECLNSTAPKHLCKPQSGPIVGCKTSQRQLQYANASALFEVRLTLREWGFHFLPSLSCYSMHLQPEPTFYRYLFSLPDPPSQQGTSEPWNYLLLFLLFRIWAAVYRSRSFASHIEVSRTSGWVTQQFKSHTGPFGISELFVKLCAELLTRLGNIQGSQL